jgi:hypothetical protein
MFDNIPTGTGKTFTAGEPQAPELDPLIVQIDLRDYAKWVASYPNEHTEWYDNARDMAAVGLEGYLREAKREHELNLLTTLLNNLPDEQQEYGDHE